MSGAFFQQRGLPEKKTVAHLNGLKFMLAEVIGGGPDAGKRLVVVDIISAGIGERVIVTTGSSARRMVGDDTIPEDAAVIGIIDEDCEFGE